jgi:hypothetical protein
MGETTTLGPAGIGRAPEGLGVYTIFSRKRWIYVGESDHVRRSLFRHLRGSTPCLGGHGPLSFSVETADGADRSARWRALVADLKPVCQASPAVTYATP